MNPSVSTPEPELDATFDHIFEYWRVLTRRGEMLAFPLPGRFIKPGGFFKWFFYWDSYFALLGLVVQGKWQLAREIVEGFVAEIEGQMEAARLCPIRLIIAPLRRVAGTTHRPSARMPLR
jgi:neutral trehalase